MFFKNKKIRPLRTAGDPVLGAVALPVAEITPEIRNLAAEMTDAMRAFDGIGLAAPQIGESLRLVVFDIPTPKSAKDLTPGEELLLPQMPLTVVNPEIVSFSDTLSRVSNNFVNRITKLVREKYYHILAFALPIIILYITFYAMEIYPYGEKSVLTLDMDGQYVYFFEQLRDVYTGQSSLIYTFERSLGGEFLGCFTYYLASPLSFLVVLFPATAITEAIMLMFLLIRMIFIQNYRGI